MRDNWPLGVTLDEQIKCLKREIAIRERVYPRWIDSGRMKQDEADYEIKAMKAALETLREIKREN